jgi:hypothetical protein
MIRKPQATQISLRTVEVGGTASGLVLFGAATERAVTQEKTRDRRAQRWRAGDVLGRCRLVAVCPDAGPERRSAIRSGAGDLPDGFSTAFDTI